MRRIYKGAVCSWIQDKIYTRNLVIAGAAMMGCLLTGVVINKGISLLLWGIVAVVYGIWNYSRTYQMEVQIVAKETAVGFKALGDKKVIKYDDIARIDLKREAVQNENIRFIERITFHLSNGEEYWLSKPMDDVDFTEVMETPELLAERFNSSLFQELKSYIEGRLPIMAGEPDGSLQSEKTEA